MSKEPRTDYIQWGFDLVKNTYLNKVENLQPQDDLYLSYLFPFSKEMYTSECSVLLFGGHSFDLLRSRESIVARDGLIPLSLFFAEISPDDFKSMLIIPIDLWFIVPTQWRERVQFYRVKGDNIFSSDNLPKKIFITGILNSTLADPDEFDDSLKFLRESIGENNLNQIEVMAYFPDKRNDLWGSWEEENVLRYSASVFKNTKLDIKTPQWGKIKEETSFKDCLYYEVNSGRFITDSFLQHFALSRGAGTLPLKNPELPGFTLIKESRVSLYHSYQIFSLNYKDVEKYSDPLKSPHVHYFKRILEFQNKGVKINHDWEKWYASYLKKFYKHKKKGSNLI